MSNGDSQRASNAAGEMRSRLKLTLLTHQRGPVSLARCLDEQKLLFIERADLSRVGVYDYLESEGYPLPDFGDEDEALAGFLYIAGTVGLVFVNANDPVPRRRFTAAHELGHFILHRDRMAAGRWIGDAADAIREIDDDTSDGMEREANRFAAELLMPAEICRARADHFRNEHAICPRIPFAYHLAAELLVSAEAMRYRLRELGIGDE